MKRPPLTHLALGATLVALAAGTAWAVILAPRLTINGHDAQSRSGSALAIADVFGNDGIVDLLVGAPGYESGEAPGAMQNADSDAPNGPTGEVLIYAGTTNGIVNTGPEHEPWVVLHGENPGDRFGAAVQVGDVTGDSVKDVIVSAILASGHDAPRTGCVYVFDGAEIAGATAMTEISAHDAVAKVCGSQYRELFGRGLALGKFDMHAGLDIAVGAPWYSGEHGHDAAGHAYDKYLAGAVYLISNHEIETAITTTGHEIHASLTAGAGWTAAYGENLLAMGNIDATTAGHELLIFAPGAENHGHSGKGRAYLATWDSFDPHGTGEPEGFETPVVVIRGTGTMGAGDPNFIGDLNNDGFSEIGIASSTGSGTAAAGTDTNSAGGLYVVDGDLMNSNNGGLAYKTYVPATDTTPERGITQLAETTVNGVLEAGVSLAAITGELAQDKFGTSMAELDDIDGDTVPDFAVGAPWADGAVVDVNGDITARNEISGSVYVISGGDIVSSANSANRFKFKVRGTVGAPIITELLGRSNDRYGEALASADMRNNVSNATALDLLIGAPDRDPADASATTQSDDVPGTDSNDNRGAVLIETFVP